MNINSKTYNVEGKDRLISFIKKHKESLYWHIRKIVVSHEDTDTVLHLSILEMYTNPMPEINKLYVLRILTEKALDFLKEKNDKYFPNGQISIENMLINTLENDEYFIGSEAQLELQKATLLLSENQRLIFNMKYFGNMSFYDISIVLEQSSESCNRIYTITFNKIEAILKLY